MAATAEEAKKVTLRSSDGVLFEVEEFAVMQSEQIKYMVEDDCSTQIIPVANVTGNTLAKVIEHLRKHATETATEEEVKAWDGEYIKGDLDTLYDLILAANYLNAKGLLELCCQTVADIIKGKTPEQIRKTFNIKNDFTHEEEAEMRREYAWLYED